MKKNIAVKPKALGGLVLWAGSDHYSIWDALRGRAFMLPISEINKIYRIKFSAIPGFEDRFLIDYHSGQKTCLILVNQVPLGLGAVPESEISAAEAIGLYIRGFWKEPTALLLPLLLPLMICLMMGLFGLWDALVLKNPEVMSFFARPGCESGCVKKVLSLHSLVALLFLIQIFLLLLPIAFLFFQAPRYRTAFNYRMIQTYSVVTAVLGIYVFAQLMVFFPFRQYGRFVALGLDPKVEQIFHRKGR